MSHRQSDKGRKRPEEIREKVMKVESEKVKLNLMRCGNHIPNLKNTVIIIKGAFYLDRNETQHDANSVG